MKQIIKIVILSFIITISTLYANPPTKAVSLSNADINGNADYICPKPVFSNTKMFVCPKLKNINGKYDISILENISGSNYTCDYYNSNSNTKDLTCSYVSIPVKSQINKLTNSLYHNDLYKNMKNILIQQYLQQSFIPNIDLLSNDDVNLIAKTYTNIKGIQSGTIGYSKNTNNQINSLLSSIKKNLVTNIKKGSINSENYTFATFLGKIITLSPDLIKGISPVDLSLKINPKWTTNTTSISTQQNTAVENIINKIKYGFTWLFKGKKAADTVVPAHNTNYTAVSFSDFFKAPIWGYYYILMSNMDYLINKIAILLIVLIGGYIGSMHLGKTYINSKLNAQQEFGGQTQSAKYTKMLGGMGLVVFFLLSPVTKNANGNAVFYTNNTIAKNIIRKMVDTGNLIGTLTNNMGLSAYLYYFVKKEGISNLTQIKTGLDNDVTNLGYLKYQSGVINACMAEYGENKLQDFFTKLDDKAVIPASSNFNSPYVSADKINYNLCNGIAKNLVYIPRITMANIKYLANTLNVLYINKDLADNTASPKIQAIQESIATMLLLNKNFGWISVMMAPATDSIMRATDLYTTIFNNSQNTGNQKTLDKLLKAQANNKALKNAQANSENYADNHGKLENLLAKVLGSMSVYMVLPGFSELYKAVSGIIENSFNLIAHLFAGTNIIGILIINFVGKAVVSLLAKIMGFFLAIKLWNLSIEIIFTVIIIMIILFKIVFYFKDVLMYFILSIFIPLLSFSKNAEARLNKFLVEGLILALYPAILVFLVYVFIFAYSLFQFIYNTVFKAYAYNQINIVKILTDANSGGISNAFHNFYAFMLSESIITAGNAISVLFGILIAYFILMKGTNWILSKLGLEEYAKTDLQNEQFIERGMKNVNPVV